MMGSEIDEFLAHLDEMSTDSASVDSYQQLQKQKNEIKKLKALLLSMKDSTKEMLGLYKSERQITINLQAKLDSKVQEHNTLQRRFDELERTSINQSFSLTELMNELKEKQASEHENYIELSRDYFETLSDVTCFFNYEIKKPQNKVISKTERFLRDCLGDDYKKPKILQSKRAKCYDTDSIISRTSTRASKRNAKQADTESKRLKTDIWNMKSISQAASPAAIPFDEDASDICEVDSSFSYNTFSIGNETSFSFLQNQNTSSIKKNLCRCHLEEGLPELVSIGVNTESPEEPPPSLPSLSDNSHPDVIENETIPAETLEFDSYNQATIKDCLESKAAAPKTYTTSSTNTENEECALQSKEMVDQATSYEPVATCDKSTATVRSTTTRGTYTVSPETRSFGVQFPEITLEKIFSETIFELPDCLSPIEDEVEVQTASTETLTDLCNVNREIDYKYKLKTESLSFEDLLASRNPEEQSFVILGQTLFDLFLKRIRKSNESLSDDEITRKNIWKHLKRQLLDRFSELTFDETLNSSTNDFEAQERMMAYEEAINSKLKDGREEFVKHPEDYSEHENCDVNEKQSCLPDCVDELQLDNNLLSNENVSREEPCRTPSPASIEYDSSESENVSREEPCRTPSPASIEYDSSESENEVSITSMDMEPTNSESSKQVEDLESFDNMLKSLNELYSSPPPLIEPIDDLCDVMWNSIFPDALADFKNDEDTPMLSEDVLDGFDVEHEPIEIPTELDLEVIEILQQKVPESCFGEFETPKSPVFATCLETSYEPKVIPIENANNSGRLMRSSDSVLNYNKQTRRNLLHWQQSQQNNNKVFDKLLHKTRKVINVYLDSEWTGESVEVCIEKIKNRDIKILLEAIYETVEDNKNQTEICSEFSPPAPPLPFYQQKLILLIKKLTDVIPNLPQLLLEDLEEKLLRLENYSKELNELRNVSYYYTALVDLFFEGDTTMVFYFIVKCIYFFGYKAIPMIFVVIKAFPLALPKKSLLLKKYSTTIDWENMSGLELSKVHFDNNCMDSLDLTVMFLLTSVTQYYRKAHESYIIKDHELFNYVPKFYGFHLSFMTQPKLLDILMKRLADGQLENLSLSFILLAKRANPDFTVRTLMKGKLIATLEKFVSTLISSNDHSVQPLASQICLLIEVISAIAKTYNEEKSFKNIFPSIVSILGRVNNIEIKESCIKAILRIQRLIDTQKEIVTIIKDYEDSFKGSMSDGLRYAIETFVHRKDEKFFKKST